MSSFRFRPRFEQEVPLSMEEVQQIIQTHLNDPEAPCKGHIIPGFITISVLEEDRHYWSPQLTLSLEEDKNGTLIRGLYGPNASVWALFSYGYAALAILATFVSIIGFSQYSLGKDASILWLLVLLGGLAAGLYVAAQAGQKVGAEQTFMLHHFYQDAIGKRTTIH